MDRDRGVRGRSTGRTRPRGAELRASGAGPAGHAGPRPHGRGTVQCVSRLSRLRFSPSRRGAPVPPAGVTSPFLSVLMAPGDRPSPSVRRRLEKRGEGAALKCPGRRHLARRPHEAGCGSLSARGPRPPSQVRSMSSVGSRHDMRTATAAGQGPQLSASVSWTPGTSRRVPCGGGNAADVLTAPPGKRQRRPTPRGICPRDRGGPGAPPSASAGWGPRQPGRESRSSLPPPFCPKNLPVKTCLSASLPTETHHRTL